MNAVSVEITEFVNHDQPGFVRCVLVDAYGDRWVFTEKIPVVTDAAIDENSEYPQPGVVACQIIKKFRDECGREIYTIDTESFWGVTTEDGISCFDVPTDQVLTI